MDNPTISSRPSKVQKNNRRTPKTLKTREAKLALLAKRDQAFEYDFRDNKTKNPDVRAKKSVDD